ncbi:MAG: inositol-1-monophosphatase [Alphaproteobacteria bacterium]|nr:inositol-1-monophosphatase [Alphaproteobacteria bacterium]
MSVQSPDPNRVVELIAAAAAEIILPRFRALGDGEIDEKDGGELVTVADLETETWLTRELTKLQPGSTVVGEEAVFADRSVFERFNGDAPVWVIDPIDGTWNFAHGREIFAVIIGYVVNGQVAAGWIYEPVLRNVVVGVRGDGVQINGENVELGGKGRDDGYVGTAARHLFVRAEQDSTTIREVFRPNCAGHEYVQILSGERAFSAYTKLMPWDHAAGSFLVREAGGYSALLDRGHYDLARPSGELLTARSREVWQEVHAVIAKGDPA